MVARDVTLDSLFDVRSKLTDLIIAWSPDPKDPAASQDALERLVLERDQINGAINAVIAQEFASIASPELMQATQELGALSAKLDKFGQSIAEVNDVLKIADTIIQGTTKVLQLAAKVV